MTKLTYGAETREESDESIIQTLVRKGWTIIPEPEPMPAYPVFDYHTHKATYNASTNLYEIIELTAEEIQTQIEIEANMQAAMQNAAARKIMNDFPYEFLRPLLKHFHFNVRSLKTSNSTFEGSLNKNKGGTIVAKFSIRFMFHLHFKLPAVPTE